MSQSVTNLHNKNIAPFSGRDNLLTYDLEHCYIQNQMSDLKIIIFLFYMELVTRINTITLGNDILSF